MAYITTYKIIEAKGMIDFENQLNELSKQGYICTCNHTTVCINDNVILYTQLMSKTEQIPEDVKIEIDMN